MKGLLNASGGLLTLGVPAAVGAAGYALEKSKNDIARDKELEADIRIVKALAAANTELARNG